MQIYVISLLRSLKRRQFIDEQMCRLHIPYEFFDAVDGASEFDRYFASWDEHAYLINTGRVASAGEVGCFASHVGLWERCVLLDEPLLILEDDAYLHGNFPQALETAGNLIEELGFIRLQQELRKRRRLLRRVGRFGVFTYPSFPLGSQCYAISPTVAHAFLDQSRVFSAPVDVFIKRYWEHGQSLYALHPHAVSFSHFSSNTTINDRNGAGRSLPLRARRFLSRGKLVALRTWFNMNQQLR